MRRTAVVLAIVLLSACSSSKDKASDTADPGTTATPVTSAPAATGATPGASASTAASGAPRTSATAGTSTSTSGGGSGGSSGAPPSTSSAPRSTAAKGTPEGTYTYDSNGTSTINGAKQNVDGTSTLEVTEVIDGSQSSTLHNNQGDTTQSLVVKDNGTYLESLAVKGNGINTEFQFAPPALLLGDPARVGATWSWGGTSTDGKTTVSASNKVLRTETLTIGGEKVPTVVLQTHLVITGKDFSYKADTTNWVAPALRLPVKTHTVGSGTYGTLAKFTFDVTDVMRSVHPA
jgi:hypothetical protein